MTATTSAGTPPPGTDPELIALIDAARAGDMDATGELYTRFHPAVHAWIRSRVSDHYLAEDLAADTFVKVLRKISQFMWCGRNFEAWLFTIARNTIADHYRSPRSREVPAFEFLDSAAEEDVEEAVLARLDTQAAHDAVHEALDGLPAVQRECLTLRFLYGKSVAATAESMGVAFGTAKMMQFRTCKALRGSTILRTAWHLVNAGTAETLAAAVPPPVAASHTSPSGRERGLENRGKKPRPDGAPRHHTTAAGPAQQSRIDAEFARITAGLHDDLAGLHAQLAIHDRHDAGGTTMSTDIYRDSAEQFARDIGPHEHEEYLPYGMLGPCRLVTDRPHEITVLHDDGLYRHLRFKSPDHSAYWFDLITWPGVLAYRGDVGDGYIFARDRDMLAFFRGHDINPHYWAEKLGAGRNSVKRYSEERFKQIVAEYLAEFANENPMLAQTAKAEILADPDVYYESGARAVLSEWEARGAFHDTWEWDLHDYDSSFLWACHAIVAGIAMYDAARATTESVLVAGGVL